MSLGWAEGRPKVMIDKSRKTLSERYREDIQKLSRVTGKDFGEWSA